MKKVKWVKCAELLLAITFVIMNEVTNLNIAKSTKCISASSRRSSGTCQYKRLFLLSEYVSAIVGVLLLLVGKLVLV